MFSVSCVAVRLVMCRCGRLPAMRTRVTAYRSLPSSAASFSRSASRGPGSGPPDHDAIGVPSRKARHKAFAPRPARTNVITGSQAGMRRKLEDDARCPGAPRRQQTADSSSHTTRLVHAGMANFGHELRRLLAERGISLREAARRVPCNSGHLSKLASGKKRPSPEIAQRLDDELSAGGALARLVPAGTSPAAEPAAPGQLVPWAFDFGQDVTSAATRRQFTSTFLAALGIAMSARRLAAISHVGTEHVQLVESVLGELERTDAREGGDVVCDGAAALLDTVYDWIYARSYSVATGSALTEAAGQLGAWVGWTAYDADKFAMSRHYYQETLLLARLNDDRPLEARVLSYMCLQSQGRARPRRHDGRRRVPPRTRPRQERVRQGRERRRPGLDPLTDARRGGRHRRPLLRRPGRPGTGRGAVPGCGRHG